MLQRLDILGQLANEALQQTKPAFTTTGAVFAAERRCSAGLEAHVRP